MPPTLALTGASGRLGTELMRLLPDCVPLRRPDFDLTDPARIAAALDRIAPQVVIHAAAYTDVARAEADRDACWQVNVRGTRNLVRELVAQVTHEGDYVGNHFHRALLDTRLARVSSAQPVDAREDLFDVVKSLDLDQVQLE